jgi:hypothetical protein
MAKSGLVVGQQAFGKVNNIRDGSGIIKHHMINASRFLSHPAGSHNDISIARGG